MPANCNMVGQKQPGSKIMLNVLRNGKSMTVPVTLEELGKHSADDSDDAGKAEGNRTGESAWRKL